MGSNVDGLILTSSCIFQNGCCYASSFHTLSGMDTTQQVMEFYNMVAEKSWKNHGIFYAKSLWQPCHGVLLDLILKFDNISSKMIILPKI